MTWSFLLVLMLALDCVLCLPIPFSPPSLHSKRASDDMVKVCGIEVKSSSYANKCKGKTGYVYSDPNPQNVNGALDETTGKWQGNKMGPAGSRGFECDHLVEAQWLRKRINAKFPDEQSELESKMCEKMVLNKGKALRGVMNGRANMIGVPTGVNQLKNQVTREPGWKSWVKTKYSPYNFNKARGGLVSYMTDNEPTATDVATQLYDVFTAYDEASFPESEKLSWAHLLGVEYKKSISALSSKKLIDEIFGVCEANGSINPQGDPDKRKAEPDPKDATPNKKPRTNPVKPRGGWRSPASWTRAFVTGKPVASAASKPTSDDGVDYECVRQGYTPGDKLISSSKSNSTSSISTAHSTSLARTADLTSTESLSSGSSSASGSSSTRTQQKTSAAQRTASASDADEASTASLHATATAKAALRPSSAPFYASSNAPSPLHSVSRPALQPAGLLPSQTRQPGLVRPPVLASAPPPAALLPRPSSGTLAPRPASNTRLRPAAVEPTPRPILPAASKPPSGGRKAGRIHL